MLYPTISDYHLAISIPSFFSDDELKHGVISRNRQGLPLIWSFSDRITFRVLTERGAVAVSCFLRPFSDMAERLKQIQAFLKGKFVPAFVDFQYENEGILVNGNWYPILKTEWIEGLPLDEKIQDLVSSGDIRKLNDLATQWRILITNLQKLQISHGNLCHETIIVTDDYFRLLDYVDVFVPALAGKALNSLGHPNYQHPNHQPTYFNANTGDFSAFVIYLSLLALSREPTLWNKFHTEKSLLFSSSDFKSPKESRIFAHLKKSNDTEVRDLALKLESYCLEQETPIIFSSLSAKPSSFSKTNPVTEWVENNAKLLTPALLGGIFTTLVSIIVIFSSSILLLPKISPVYLVFGLIGIIFILVLLVGTAIFQKAKSKQQKINSRLKQIEKDLYSEVDNNLSNLLK